MVHENISKDGINGRARIVRVTSQGVRLPLTDYKPNLIMADWATVFANFIVSGTSSYRIGGMYLEFENVDDPDDEVTVPAFVRTEGISYYDGLSSHPTRDYLRVNLAGANVSTTDMTQWPFGNVSQFFSMSSGIVGTHGKTFSDSVNSKLFGAALVVIRSAADPTLDLIVSRLYFNSSEQQVKLPTSQLGVDWALELN